MQSFCVPVTNFSVLDADCKIRLNHALIPPNLVPTTAAVSLINFPLESCIQLRLACPSFVWFRFVSFCLLFLGRVKWAGAAVRLWTALRLWAGLAPGQMRLWPGL